MRRMRSGCCARAANGTAAAEPTTTLIKSRRLIDAPEAQDKLSERLKPALGKAPANVCFGSLADICTAIGYVRFTPMCGRLRVGKDFLERMQHWSVQPCVRPVCAVHMTAGHNTLR